MARGNSSRAASEQGDNPFKAGSPANSGLTPEAEARDFVEGFLGKGTPLDDQDEGAYDNTVDDVLQASSEARDQRDDFNQTVKMANKAIENDSVEWGSYTDAGSILPLTLGEVLNGDEGFDIIKNAVEEERPDDIEEFVREFVKDRVVGADTLREDYDSEIQVVQEDALTESVDKWRDNKEAEASRRSDEAERRSRQKFDPEDIR